MFEGLLDEFEVTHKQFNKHVPFADEVFLILKAHLVIEVHLLEFIKSRVTHDLFKEINKPGEVSFYVKLILAQAIAGRDEIQHENIDLVWKALYTLNNLRNSIAHNLEFNSDSITDRMKNFINEIDPIGELRKQKLTSDNLLIEFRKAAKYLCVKLALAKNPLKFEDELVIVPNN